MTHGPRLLQRLGARGMTLARVGAAALLLIVAVLASSRVARSWQHNAFPPPGALVDVGGYRLHLHCLGEGSPTVVLDAGLLDFSVHWALVQPGIARHTRVCSYDRAGTGWSEPSPRARTSDVIVEELHALLDAAGVHSPYLLVGHSFGGINVRLYAHAYPKEVAGLVLVDAASEFQLSELPMLGTAMQGVDAQYRSLARWSGLGLLALVPTLIPARGLPTVAAAQYRAVLSSTPYFATAVRELRALERSLAHVQASHGRAPGRWPVTVISRGKPSLVPLLPAAETDRMERVWRALQGRLVSEGRHGRHVIAEESGHDVHLEQPGVVIEETVRMLRLARGAASGGDARKR